MKIYKNSNKILKKKSDFSANLAKDEYWMFGSHACYAALDNPKRIIKRILATTAHHEVLKKIPSLKFSNIEFLHNNQIDVLFPIGTLHQGIAILTKHIQHITVPEFLKKIKNKPHVSLLALDQVQDPRNFGAIIRSASAFNIDALIIPDRRTPEESGAIAKAAAGALECLTIMRVTNLARTITTFKSENFWTIGLSQNATTNIEKATFPDKSVVIIGSEGKGLRTLTEKSCDFLVKIEINSQIESLNNASAAAIALFERARQLNQK